jgi:hypothetical protein
MKSEMMSSELISSFKRMGSDYCSRYDGQLVELIDPIVLAWYRERDGRSCLVDKAVCVSQIGGSSSFTHVAGLFARNPKTPGKDAWRPYQVTDINFSWLELFNKAPTLEDAFTTYHLFFSKLPNPGWERYDAFEMTGT